MFVCVDVSHAHQQEERMSRRQAQQWLNAPGPAAVHLKGQGRTSRVWRTFQIAQPDTLALVYLGGLEHQALGVIGPACTRSFPSQASSGMRPALMAHSHTPWHSVPCLMRDMNIRWAKIRTQF